MNFNVVKTLPVQLDNASNAKQPYEVRDASRRRRLMEYATKLDTGGSLQLPARDRYSLARLIRQHLQNCGQQNPPTDPA